MDAEEEEEEEEEDDEEEGAEAEAAEEEADEGEPRLKELRVGGRTPEVGPPADFPLGDFGAFDLLGVEGPSDDDLSQLSGFNLLKKDGSFPDDMVPPRESSVCCLLPSLSVWGGKER